MEPIIMIQIAIPITLVLLGIIGFFIVRTLKAFDNSFKKLETTFDKLDDTLEGIVHTQSLHGRDIAILNDGRTQQVQLVEDVKYLRDGQVRLETLLDMNRNKG